MGAAKQRRLAGAITAAGLVCIWALVRAIADAQPHGGPASETPHVTRSTDDGSSPAANSEDVDGERRLRINDLQLLGTHNSYHVAPDSFASETIATVAPAEAKAIDCTQRSLTEQLALLGLRHFELDCYLDPDGRLFCDPLVLRLARAAGRDVPAFDPDGVLKAPGIKILHSPDFDVRTTAFTLAAAMTEIRAWSDRNPGHVPLFLLLELKSESFSPTRPLPWGQEGFVELHRELEAVWPRCRILTPRDVQGDAATLREAVEGRGWPDLDDHRGKVVFLLDNEGPLRDQYLASTADDRLLFVSVDRDHPAAAWMKRNDPVAHEQEIRGLVRDGFLVRTRADSGTVEARGDDGRRRDLAIATGAQLISTDYPEPDPRFSPYVVRLPPPPEPAGPRVHHVVICWLEQPGDANARRRIVEASRAFENLPGVVAVSAGEPIESDRGIVDDSFDVAVTITFRDQAALDAYQAHPDHHRARQEVLSPLVARMIIYDFHE